jgi:MFS family permease
MVGLQLVINLHAPAFKELVITSSSSTNESAAYMGRYAMIAGISTLLLSLISLFIGPQLLRSKGWRFSTLIAPLLGIIGTFTLLVHPLLSSYMMQQVALRALEYGWMVPLVQIAFLTYSQSERFLIQGCALLVIAPLLHLGTQLVQLNISSPFLISFFIFALMIAATLIIVKKNRTLSKSVS